MAEGIVYLDVDDEITSAAQRIRSAAGTRVALVVPYGSRIATSRMNFRLLSREAVMNNRRLSIVSGDAAVRSLAASAGLPVFGSVAEYESTGTNPDPAGTHGAAIGAPAPADAAAPAADAAGVAGVPPASLAASGTVVNPTPPDRAVQARKSQRPKRPIGADATAAGSASAGAAGAGSGAAGAGSGAATLRAALPVPSHPASSSEPAHAGDDGMPPFLGRRSRAPAVAAIGLTGLALIVAGVAAYLFLPAASVTLTPRPEAIAPLEITVSADPEATVVDPVNGVVPAIRLDVPVEAARTFTTIGTHVEEAAAGGSVTFTNYDTSSGVSIPGGSIVSTEGGIRFRTTRTVALQPAKVFPSFAPTSGSTQVVAVKPGEQGNVPANTIRIVPQGQDPVLLRINNPAETTGGTHTETPEIKPAEVDKAVAALQVDLTKAFSDAVVAGAGAPSETKLFPETAVLGAATPSVDPKSLVGQALATFDLGLTASGTVIAVDPRPVRTIARAQLESRISADHRLLEDSVAIAVGVGTVGEDGQVTFQATVRATEVRIVDERTLPGLVKGKTKSQAEAALASLGTATVTLWPDWVTTVTTVDSRLTVTVGDTTGGAGPSAAPASGGPRPATTPKPSGAPRNAASGSPARSAAPSASP